MPFGFRLYTRVPRPPAGLVGQFDGAATGNLGDALGRSAAMGAGVRPTGPGMRCCGVAVTVRCPPGDNLVAWKAVELAQPGNVLVVATGGYPGHAVWGDLTSRAAVGRGLAGLVTDGAVRDVDGIVESGLPVFAAAVTPNSPQKDGPGELNVPVVCGGQRVEPGAVVVPRREAEAARVELRRVQRYEQERLAAIARRAHPRLGRPAAGRARRRDRRRLRADRAPVSTAQGPTVASRADSPAPNVPGRGAAKACTNDCKLLGCRARGYPVPAQRRERGGARRVPRSRGGLARERTRRLLIEWRQAGARATGRLR